MSAAVSRRYDSTLRQDMAARTRAAVFEAAGRIFVERGWEGTSMRDIARAAGCSVETVYSKVGNKAALLKALLDVAVVGDDAAVSLAERPWFGVDGDRPLAERAAELAALAAAIYRRTAPLRRVLDIAAEGHAELRELDAKCRRDERISRTAIVSAFAGRPLTEVEADGIQGVFSNEMYLLLTRRSGWTHEQYQDWAAATVVRLLDLREKRDHHESPHRSGGPG
ncbi:TetR/AcrR family transcriptional regulator [Nocardia asteroides]|uniref:TetR/AcrR family transcriptional regulator n=1 Tax=Nocardia asteroides TaxID=1824 RepID=UPI001E2D4B8D|nr:TetR/AcrR family transcriptional regulator [Nocardia asteroides]UGT57174.1 TetR/AcrR family transcriptional regulator [Nocardia asteroides]